MEPLSLTCPKCATFWKVIKAGKGPITCPNCKAVLDAPPGTPPAGPAPEATVTPEPKADVAPIAVATVAPMAPDPPRPIPGLTPTAALPPMDIPDTDDPGLHADFDDRFETRRKSGTHPLLKVGIILLILMILVPLALFILFAVVCAVIFSR